MVIKKPHKNEQWTEIVSSVTEQNALTLVLLFKHKSPQDTLITSRSLSAGGLFFGFFVSATLTKCWKVWDLEKYDNKGHFLLMQTVCINTSKVTWKQIQDQICLSQTFAKKAIAI